MAQMLKGIKRRRDDVSEEEIRIKASRKFYSKQELFVLLLDEDNLYHDLTEANREYLTDLIKENKYQSVINYCADDVGLLKEVYILSIELEEFVMAQLILKEVKD